MAAVEIQNLTRQNQKVWAGLPFSKIATDILPDWEISLVFVTPEKARALNRKWRRKHYTPNVLSYEVGPKSGEIIICPSTAKKQAPDFRLSTFDFFLFLFIHALLHLEGRAHGVTMERRERQLLAKFADGVLRAVPSPNETTHRNRHRHRHLPGKTGHR